jgi:hypothetical protein
LWFLLVYTNKITATRAWFLRWTWNLGQINDHPTCDSNEVSCITTGKDGRNTNPWHKLRRGLFWRRQQRPITKVRIHFVIDSVCKLLDIPLYTPLVFHLLLSTILTCPSAKSKMLVHKVWIWNSLIEQSVL